ncbi:glyoxylate reductase [Micromonospora pallida]|uniref:Glyoxylate reductase n=1 Tax=Micromonospora pallida TaxID=145854 RepID=A0A1C6S0Y0_9ACTN|nr:D-glycerate dehydrogenase [Micromonospora pallida]SCL22979.1 glyoxylate reductase [Micromonospora pallida]
MAQVVVLGTGLPDRVLDEIGVRHTVRTLTRDQLDTAEGRAALAHAEGVVVIGQEPVTEEFLAAAPKLRVVSLRAVGYDRVDLAACRRRGVAVCHTPGVLDGAVADLTALLVVGIARRFGECLDSGRGSWATTGARPALGTDVAGKVLGILGMGRIGRRVARTCAAGFGMEIIYHTRSGPTAEDDAFGASWVTREELFARADFLTIHLPLTPETRHSVGERELAAMKPGAYLVNTARGDVVDERALVAALRSGRLAGAGLDVLSTEPPDPDNPLLHLPNVMVTPHVGSATEETRYAMAELAARNLLNVLAGEEPVARVV